MDIIVGIIAPILAGIFVLSFSGIFVNNCCEYQCRYCAKIIDGIIVGDILGIICRYFGGYIFARFIAHIITVTMSGIICGLHYCQ